MCCEKEKWLKLLDREKDIFINFVRSIINFVSGLQVEGRSC